MTLWRNDLSSVSFFGQTTSDHDDIPRRSTTASAPALRQQALFALLVPCRHIASGEKAIGARAGVRRGRQWRCQNFCVLALRQPEKSAFWALDI
ncbi:hypothetical protein niasHT_022127 [Heterodera trifolii]|uniref:Uncharacterized protein n=1 Tax=Heterodera trifolii TaxID=157864 RepID=A0ABD2KA08_9BILA